MSKKVLHVITGLGDGGAEGVLTRLCINSDKAEHVVISLTDEGKYGAILRESGIKVSSLGMSSGILGVLRFAQLVKLIKRERPQIVQTWLYHSDLLGGLAARMSGIRSVFWNIRLSHSYGGDEKKTTVLIARVCAKASKWLPEKIICCAEKAATMHVAIGYTKRKMIVIPNGYDVNRFSPSTERGKGLRGELAIADNEVLLGMVGRFHPQKDHENLLKTLLLVKNAGVSCRCLLVGTGLVPSNQGLVNRLEALGLTDNIILAGPRTDIPAVMNALDIHVLSSRSEGFPNVIAEAMACGTPCVSTDVGDAKVIIGETGAVCAAGKPEELADRILQLVTEMTHSPEAWNNRMRECRERIMRNYSLEKSISLYEHVWGL